MAVTASQLKQVVSARVGGVGATTSHLLGGTNTISDDVDIAFGFTLKCRHASNSVTMRWRNESSGKNNKPTLEHTTGSDAYYGGAVGDIDTNQRIGTAGAATAIVILDAAMQEVAAISKIVAVYYEAPVANSGKISIVSSNNGLGDIDLKSDGASALLIPRMAISTFTTAFTFEAGPGGPVGDILKVIVLANST